MEGRTWSLGISLGSDFIVINPFLSFKQYAGNFQLKQAPSNEIR